MNNYFSDLGMNKTEVVSPVSTGFSWEQKFRQNGLSGLDISVGSRFIHTAGAIAGAYHGYKRTGKASWALVYSVLGALSPLITGAVMVAQGFGKRK